MIIIRLFSRRWILTTLLAAAGVFVLARLGVWQLDRLAERRLFNARVLAAVQHPEIKLDAQNLKEDLSVWEYARISVQGVYDFEHQVALRNQVYQEQPGAALLTPLKIAGTQTYILVNRGWIPAEEFEAGKAEGRWSQYDQPGEVTVEGVIRRAQLKPDFGMLNDPTPVPGSRLNAWNLANIPQMAAQLPYPILPVYIQETGQGDAQPVIDELQANKIYPIQPELDLSEGPHFGYALQWFAFAALLFFGYPYFVHKEDKTAGERTKSNPGPN